LVQALADGKITEADLDKAAVRLLTTRVMLGEFADDNPYNSIPYDVVDCPAHQAHNKEAARQSLVLLKNENNFLPADPAKVKNIAVIGPNADSIAALDGNYNGTAGEYITPLSGIRRAFPDARIRFSQGCHLWKNKLEGCSPVPDDRLSEAVAMAKRADLTVLCVGLDPSLEGEEMHSSNNRPGGDKPDLYLPECQRNLVRAVCEASDKVVIVMLAGSAMDPGEEADNARALIHAWYPGARGGEAIGDLIAGKFSPSGKLPVTFYRGDAALPEFTDYAMENRTYRFYRDEPLYPFGFGLSYSSFAYDSLQVRRAEDGSLTANVNVTNTGKCAAMETVQMYTHLHADSRTPVFQLCAAEKVLLAPGESASVTLTAQPYWLSVVTESGERVPAGAIDVYVGGHQPDEKSTALTGTACLKAVL